jgi:hypothetical protein
VAQTVADAQAVGRAAMRLAYDVGAVLGLAARGLVSGTLDVADAVAPRRVARPVSGGSALPLRKPPAPVPPARRSGARARRLAG